VVKQAVEDGGGHHRVAEHLGQLSTKGGTPEPNRLHMPTRRDPDVPFYPIDPTCICAYRWLAYAAVWVARWLPNPLTGYKTGPPSPLTENEMSGVLPFGPKISGRFVRPILGACLLPKSPRSKSSQPRLRPRLKHGRKWSLSQHEQGRLSLANARLRPVLATASIFASHRL
jgi:hypothetical protein